MRISLCRLLPRALALSALLAVAGCSVVHINGTLRTDDDRLCVVRPTRVAQDVHKPLLELLRRKGFEVRELAHGTSPSACRQTIVYAWSKEQYYGLFAISCG